VARRIDLLASPSCANHLIATPRFLSFTLLLCYIETLDDLPAAAQKTIREHSQGAKIEELSKTFTI
jgi:hypothetical protein